MNNKGMTTIELITSFILASIVLIILFNVVISLKDMYISNRVKTELLIKQANLSRSLNKEITSGKIVSAVDETIQDDSKIYSFTIDGIVKELIIKDDEISFDGYTYLLDNSTSSKGVENEYVSTVSLSDSNLLIIDIPIENNMDDHNYGVKVVYRFNAGDITLNLQNNI